MFTVTPPTESGKRKILLMLSCASALLLAGCLSTTLRPVPEQAVTLHEDFSEELPLPVKFLEFSSDGSTFLVGGSHHFVNLYDADDYVKLAAVNRSNTRFLKSSVLGAGYIDPNTWYFAAGNATVSIRSIHPNEEIFRHSFDYQARRSIIANDHHIAYYKTLLDWHAGKDYPISTAHVAALWPKLTDSSRVLTYNWNNGGVVLDDPVNGKTIRWKAGFAVNHTVVTEDERYAVTLSKNGACKAWKLPETREIGRCGYAQRGADTQVQLIAHPDDHAFAVAVNDEIRVYTLEPYRLELLVKMPGTVSALAFSPDGKLAAGDEAGHIRVWDTVAGRLYAQYDFRGEREMQRFNTTDLLAFQPHGSRLAAALGHDIVVFDLAEPSSSPKRLSPIVAGDDAKSTFAGINSALAQQQP